MTKQENLDRLVELVERRSKNFSGSALDISKISFVLKSIVAEAANENVESGLVERLRTVRNRVEMVNAILIEDGVDSSPSDIAEVANALAEFSLVLRSANAASS